MVNATDQLADELRAHHLKACYYILLKCALDGEIRVAQPLPPREKRRCPRCGRLCPSSLISRGGTRRRLPFWESL